MRVLVTNNGELEVYQVQAAYTLKSNGITQLMMECGTNGAVTISMDTSDDYARSRLIILAEDGLLNLSKHNVDISFGEFQEIDINNVQALTKEEHEEVHRLVDIMKKGLMEGYRKWEVASQDTKKEVYKNNLDNKGDKSNCKMVNINTIKKNNITRQKND